MDDIHGDDAIASPTLPSEVLMKRIGNIRASCDNCTKSKVRCSKDQPRCQRCIYQGVTCTYSPSQRSRKRPVGAFNSRTRRSDTADVSREQSSSGSALRKDTAVRGDSAEPIAGFDLDDMPSSDLDLQQFCAPSLLQTDVDDPLKWKELFATLDGQAPIQADIVPSLPDASPMLHSQSQSQSQLARHGSLEGSDARSSWSFHNNHERPSSRPRQKEPEMDTTHSPLVHRCSDLVISTIQKLDLPTCSCPSRDGTEVPISVGSMSGHGTASQSFDEILQENNSAMDNILTVLRCPCSARTDLVFLIATVCSRVLSRYQVSLNRCADTTSRSGDSWCSDGSGSGSGSGSSMATRSHSSSSATNSSRETLSLSSSPGQISIPSVKIGAYTLGRRHADQIVAHVVLTELDKVEEIVDVFNRTYFDRKDGHSSYASQTVSRENNGTNQLHSTLVSFLRSQLRAVVVTAQEQLNYR